MAFTPEEERLLALMQALTSRREYATGAEAFPGAVRPEDAAAIAADLHLAIDQGVERRAEAVVKEGSTIACRAGCTSCCEQLVGVWAGEADLVAAWLEEPEHAGERAAFLAAYPRWLEQSRAPIERVAERTAARDADGQRAALVAHWRQRILCAFNRDGLCMVYPVRPTVCRTCHALDTAERCVPDDEHGSAAESLHFVPLERLLAKAEVLQRAVHNARGAGRATPLVLCGAVHARLSARPA